MAMDAQALAKKLHDALAQKTDGNGVPTKISDQTLNYAKGIVAALKAATFSHLPGTVVGVTAAGSPLSNGAATGGVIVIQPGPMIAKVAMGVPPEALPMLKTENTAIIGYLATVMVNFSPGGITGQCTNTAESPGPLQNGAGTGGKLTGATGAAATGFVAAQLGAIGPDMLKHYTALIDYLVANVEGKYASGSVVGVCPPAAGSLTAGAGTGGTFS